MLEQDPKNSVALASVAQLYFDQKKLDEARWYKKLVDVDPNNKDAYYTLGVIAWTKTFQPRMEARAKLGMKPDDPGPLKDKKVARSWRPRTCPSSRTGLQNLQKALAIDNEYDDAMAYMNLFYRERADLAETADGLQEGHPGSRRLGGQDPGDQEDQGSRGGPRAVSRPRSSSSSLDAFYRSAIIWRRAAQRPPVVSCMVPDPNADPLRPGRVAAAPGR